MYYYDLTIFDIKNQLTPEETKIINLVKGYIVPTKIVWGVDLTKF